jgi:hypothetical protein
VPAAFVICSDGWFFVGGRQKTGKNLPLSSWVVFIMLIYMGFNCVKELA